MLGVTFAFGLIGFYDDYLKLVVRNPRGLAARWKYFWQSVLGLAPPLLLYCTAHSAGARPMFFLPFVKSVDEPLRRLRLHRARLFHDRRHEQRGEPHRRARRPRDHAGGAGGRRRSGIFAYASGNAMFAHYLAIPGDPAAPASC